MEGCVLGVDGAVLGVDDVDHLEVSDGDRLAVDDHGHLGVDVMGGHLVVDDLFSVLVSGGDPLVGLGWAAGFPGGGEAVDHDHKQVVGDGDHSAELLR